MLFDPRRYLESIDRDQLNHGMRRLEEGDGATRATCATQPLESAPHVARVACRTAADDKNGRHPPDSSLNHGMRPSEGPTRATRATCATRADRGTRNSPDAAVLLALLRERGPLSYGAAASALGWGATRAWRAEAALKAAGRIEHDPCGRAAVKTRAGA